MSAKPRAVSDEAVSDASQDLDTRFVKIIEAFAGLSAQGAVSLFRKQCRHMRIVFPGWTRELINGVRKQ